MPTLESLNNAVRQRVIDLKPVDVTDKMDRYVYQFAGEAAPTMQKLSDQDGGGRRFELNRRAMVQLAQRLRIPVDFLDRQPDNLKFALTNYWAQNGGYEREVMMRTMQDNQVRGILSSSYTPLDDIDVVPLIADILGDEEVDIKIMDFHNDYSHIRIVFNRLTTEARPGDIIQTGIHISNSEVGMRSIRTDALVYRLICTNGMVRDENNGRSSIRHIGNSDRLKDQLRMLITDAKENAQHLTNQFKEAVNHKLLEPTKLIEQHAQSNDLSQAQLKAVLENFAYYGDNTLYGAINSFTEVAQKQDTVEGRYQFERVGTRLLDRVAG